MTREEIVARAMALSDGLDWDDLPEENTVYEDRCDYRRMARAAIAAYESALREEGYVIARKEECQWSTSQKQTIEDGVVYVTVSGLTGVGKSVVYTEIATALAAIGLRVEHAAPRDAATEMRLNGQDQLEQYEPRILLAEQNIPRAAPKGDA